MMASATRSGVLVVRDERYSGGRPSPYGGVQSLVPILLGLAIPATAAAILAPDLLSNPTLVFGLYLLVIFIISSVVFIRSVFNPGSIVEATFNPASRTAEFVRVGPFTTTKIEIAFDKITKIYLETNTDEDGYRSYIPVVELSDGELMQLPEGTTQGQISSVRAIVGR